MFKVFDLLNYKNMICEALKVPFEAIICSNLTFCFSKEIISYSVIMLYTQKSHEHKLQFFRIKKKKNNYKSI